MRAALSSAEESTGAGRLEPPDENSCSEIWQMGWIYGSMKCFEATVLLL